jgi:outer membrane protein insertion porin family
VPCVECNLLISTALETRPNRKPPLTISDRPKSMFLRVAGAARMAMAALALAFVAPIGLGAIPGVVSEAQAAVVSRIEVRGNSRMDAQTIISFLTIKPGKPFNNQSIDDSVKALFATGLFADVSIYQNGGTLIVEVDESGIVNQVFFEGNKRLKDEALAGAVQTASRSTYSEEKVASDVDRILEAYARVGRKDASVTYEVVPLANERVNVIFRINEGDKTKIRTVSFVGNKAFGEARLRSVMETKPTNWFSWLNNDDILDQDKLQTDQERLRRFYFNNGYADFQILSADVQFDSEGNAYSVIISVDEGQRYTFGNVTIESSIAELNADALYSRLEVKAGRHYSSQKVENSIIALTEAVAEQGYAFGQVTPRGDRHFENATIDVTFQIDQGQRVYIQQINIVGNDRTREHVIRREFDISEGDALNQVLIQRTKRRLEALGFFEKVEITTRQGDAPDRVIVVVKVADKATGEFSIGGGYSTSSGPLGEISFSEKNFLGRGQYIKIAGGFGTDERRFTFSFTEPYFLGYRMSAGFDVVNSIVQSNSTRSYGSETLSATVRFGIPITEKLSSQVFYAFSNESTTIASSLIEPTSTVDADAIQGNTVGEISSFLVPPASPRDWMKSGFGYSLTYSDLDNPRDPREGLYLNVRQDFYGAGGDGYYLRTEGTAIGYVPLSDEVDIAAMLRGRGGFNYAFSESGYRTLDNFFQGSRHIRGFDNYGFGPRDPVTGDALGGKYYWNATAEITFPFPLLPDSLGIRGAIFADAGQLWGYDDAGLTAFLASNPGFPTQQITDNSLRASVGGSIIWASPFGPLRFDYAVPIARTSWDKTREFNFGISSSF